MASYVFNKVITGANLTMEYQVAKTAADTMKLKLYTNVISFSNATVVGDLTECVDGNYAEYALTPASWSVAWNTDQSEATFTTDNTITFDSSATIYGAYLTNSAGTILIGVSEFGSAKSYDAGDQITFTEGVLADKPV